MSVLTYNFFINFIFFYKEGSGWCIFATDYLWNLLKQQWTDKCSFNGSAPNQVSCLYNQHLKTPYRHILFPPELKKNQHDFYQHVVETDSKAAQGFGSEYRDT